MLNEWSHASGEGQTRTCTGIWHVRQVGSPDLGYVLCRQFTTAAYQVKPQQICRGRFSVFIKCQDALIKSPNLPFLVFFISSKL